MPLNTNSLDIEGSLTQHAEITDASQVGLDITGDMTMETWVKAESLASNMVVVGKRNHSTGQGYGFMVFADGSIAIVIIDASLNTSQARSSTTPVSIGTWVHLAGTYDLSLKECEVFVGGTQQALVIDTKNATQADDTAEPFAIGVGGSGDGNPYDGLVDESRVYNDIRTGTELTNNKDDHIDPTTPNLQGYWRLNNDYTDETSNGNDLTAVNSPVFVTDVPFEGSVPGGGNPMLFAGGVAIG